GGPAVPGGAARDYLQRPVGGRRRAAGRQRRLPLALLRGRPNTVSWTGSWSLPVLPSSIREVVIKPTPQELGIDPGLLAWERSGDMDGSIEIAFPLSVQWSRGDWVLMRVVGDQGGRILVFDRNEW